MDKKYSFVPGRFQPLHRGHLALFDKLRKEGKNIAVGIQDTAIDEDNPYTIEERVRMFQKKAPDIKLYRIPALNEICWGRDVGYGRRAINLSSEIEKISATDIRGKKRGPKPAVPHKAPKDMDDSELEVLRAVEAYKLKNNLRFLDITQIFHVIRELGYRKD